MDFTGLIGLAAGAALIFFGMTGMAGPDAARSFVDFRAMAITFGGTAAAALVAFPFSYFRKIPAQIRIAARRNRYDPKRTIGTMANLAQEARRSGLLSLEKTAEGLEDPFLRESVLLIVDAIAPEKVREMLENELDALEERHAQGWKFYEKAAAFAPAFGLIGTLIGLINMLGHLNMESSGSAAAIGRGMAVALVATFYGALLSNLVLLPLGHKLHVRHDEERLCKEIVAEGVVAIQAGENPRHIERRLNAFLHEKERSSP